MKVLLLCTFYAVEVWQCLNVGVDLRKMEDCTRRRFSTLAVAKGAVLQRSTSFYFSKDIQQFNLGKTLDSLPHESQLIAALDSFYQQELQAELSEFQSQQKKKWLKYLPTIGVTYTLEGKPRPAISWSSNLLYSSQKEKAQIEAKKKSIYKRKSTSRKYNTSYITPHNLHSLWEKFFDLMESEKQIWLKPPNIKQLCKTLKTNPKYLSQAINQATGLSIISYFHCYRVEFFISKIQNGEAKLKTIEDILTEVGFQNRRSFYRAFLEDMAGWLVGHENPFSENYQLSHEEIENWIAMAKYTNLNFFAKIP